MTPTPVPPRQEILTRVKAIMRRDLKLGDEMPIADDMEFFGGEADIDSLDILLLLGSVEKEFKIKIPNEAVGKQVFQSVATLVNYVEEQVNATGGGPAAAGPSVTQAIDPLARLPHGPEFRFVSRVIALRPGESVEAAWALKGDEPFFAGHFPGRPIVPGVLIAEAMAQAAGLAVPVDAANPKAIDGKLVQVDVRFEQPVVPPAEIVLRCQMTRAIGGLYQFSATASVGAMVVSRGTLTLNCTPIEAVAVGGKA
ncbi:MAG TPA: 3-hydroxyacyl-ACP dehydratase FabZ family protein [Humisphaera sp.]